MPFERLDALALTKDVWSALENVISLLPDNIEIVDAAVKALQQFADVSSDCGFKFSNVVEELF